MSDPAVPAGRWPGALAGLLTAPRVEAALIVSWSAGFIGIRFGSDHAPKFLILLRRSLVSGPFLCRSP
jgi:hypothetical protein